MERAQQLAQEKSKAPFGGEGNGLRGNVFVIQGVTKKAKISI